MRQNEIQCTYCGQQKKPRYRDEGCDFCENCEDIAEQTSAIPDKLERKMELQNRNPHEYTQQVLGDFKNR